MRIFRFIIIGIIVTALVAWLFGSFPKIFPTAQFMVSGPKDVLLEVAIYERLGTQDVMIYNRGADPLDENYSIGKKQNFPLWFGCLQDNANRAEALTIRGADWSEQCQGWPLPAFRSVMHGNTNSGSYYLTYGEFYIGFLPWNDSGAALAYIPIWWGLLVDVLLFSTAYAVGEMLFLKIFHWIWAIRHPDKTICPICKYDLRGSGGREAGCPECGWERAEGEGKSGDNV